MMVILLGYLPKNKGTTEHPLPHTLVFFSIPSILKV